MYNFLMDEKMTMYFSKPGNANTAHCLNIVKSEVQDNGYRHVIVASTTGETGTIFAEGLKGLEANLMVVSYADGIEGKAMSPSNKKKITDRGATVFSAPSLTMSLDRSFGQKYEEAGPSFIIRETLSRFGQGLRVCCECVMAATDGGLVAEGMEVISVAGTESGSDTVAIVRAMSTKRFRELKVLEILAKPRD